MILKIKNATKQGYIECENFGVADFSYPTSKLRRGRVQKYPNDKIGGGVLATLTCTDNALFRIECYEDNEMNLKVLELLDKEKCVRIQDTDTGKKYRISIRKLIPEECFILQGMTAEDVEKCRALGISNSSLYRIAGNGLISNIIQYISEHLYKATINKDYTTTDEKMVVQYGKC